MRENKRKRIALCMAMLTAIAIVLNFFKFNIPYCPEFFTVDFSAFPELLASIAYGPIFGIIVCFIKAAVFAIIEPVKLVSHLTNFALDSIFVFLSGLFYMKSMKFVAKKYKDRKKRNLRIFVGSTLSALISLVPQFVLTRFVAYPLFQLDLGLGTVDNDLILAQCQISMEQIKSIVPAFISSILPDINSLAMSVLVYNLPITFLKLFVITLLTMAIYKYISPFMHDRKK